MARPGVTYDDVAKACETIKAAGDKPTINRVRNLLGTGSPNNLAAHIREWKKATTQTKEATAIKLPDSVIVAITNEIGRSVQEAKAELQQELQTLQSEHAKVITHCDKLDDKIKQARDGMAKTNDELQAANAVTKERESTISQLQESLEKSKSETEEHRTNAEISKVESAKVLIKQEVLMKQVEGLDNLRKECNQNGNKANVAQAKEAAAHDTIKRLEDTIKEMKQQFEKTVQGLKLKVSELESTANNANTLLNDTQGKLSECEMNRAVLVERLDKIKINKR